MKKKRLLAVLTSIIAACLFLSASPSFAGLGDYSVDLTHVAGNGDDSNPILFELDDIYLDLELFGTIAKIEDTTSYFDYSLGALMFKTTTYTGTDPLNDAAIGYEVDFNKAYCSDTFDPGTVFINDIWATVKSNFGIIDGSGTVLWKWSDDVDTNGNPGLVPHTPDAALTIALEWTVDASSAVTQVNLDAYFFGPQDAKISSNRFSVYSDNLYSNYQRPATLDQDAKTTKAGVAGGAVTATETITLWQKADETFIPGDYYFSVRFVNKEAAWTFDDLSAISIALTIDSSLTNPITLPTTSGTPAGLTESEIEALTPLADPAIATTADDGWLGFKMVLAADGTATVTAITDPNGTDAHFPYIDTATDDLDPY